MQPGDLIFIRGTEGIAGPIKKLTKSPYTHIAGVVLDDTLIESQSMRRTGYQAVETYRGVSDVYTCTVLSEKQRQEVVKFVTNQMGTKYDYLLIGWLAIRLLFGDVVPFRASKTRQICTTLWADAYKAVGVDLCPGIAHPTPGELAQSKYLQLVGSF